MRITCKGYGGVGFHRRARASGLERSLYLHDLSALLLRRRPALPHPSRLQRQTAAASAGRPPEEEVQALGTHLAEGVRLGS